MNRILFKSHTHTRTHTTFKNIFKSLPGEFEQNKLLINYMAPNVYDYIAEYDLHEKVLETLKVKYIKLKNDIFNNV